MENPNRQAGASELISKDLGLHYDLIRTKQLPQISLCRKESSDEYYRVICLLNRWRVIECRDRIQWILQRRCGKTCARPRWDGKSYCTTQKTLIRCWREKTNLPIPVEITSLPEQITRGSK